MNNTKKEKNDIVASCTHDEIIQFITQQNKTNYSRNIFTGTLDIINDVVKETYHTEAHNECQECGQYISYSDDFILNAPAINVRPVSKLFLLESFLLKLFLSTNPCEIIVR